jgi:hypothetical protein
MVSSSSAPNLLIHMSVKMSLVHVSWIVNVRVYMLPLECTCKLIEAGHYARRVSRYGMGRFRSRMRAGTQSRQATAQALQVSHMLSLG